VRLGEFLYFIRGKQPVAKLAAGLQKLDVARKGDALETGWR
jgi:hypothetical protein